MNRASLEKRITSSTLADMRRWAEKNKDTRFKYAHSGQCEGCAVSRFLQDHTRAAGLWTVRDLVFTGVRGITIPLPEEFSSFIDKFDERYHREHCASYTGADVLRLLAEEGL